MRRHTYPGFLGLLLAFTLVSLAFTYDDADEGGSNSLVTSGEASVTVRGDIEASYSGNAVFGTDPDADGGYGIALFEGDVAASPMGQFVALQHKGGRPPEGTYPIDNDGAGDAFFGVYATNGANPREGELVLPESGELVITSSSSERLVGSFTFSGRVFGPAGPQGTAGVEGTFDAQFVDALSFPNTP